MNLLNSFSKKESARRVHNIGCCHSAPYQFTNHNSRQFRDDTSPSGHRSEHYENEAENKDLCFVCGFVSANEFFSFPNDINTRHQWATFCDLPLGEIKPHFRLCDRHFKPDDYRISIQRKLLIQTSSVPTLQPKLKQGFGPSTNNSLQSSQNSINISNPTLNENTSQNAIYSPVVQGNLSSEVLKLRTRCSLLEDTVADLKKRIERLDKRPVEVSKMSTLPASNNQTDEFVNFSKCLDAQEASMFWHTSVSSQHETFALVESVEKVADEDGYSTDSSMPPLEISSDELHTSEGPLEKFPEEGDSRYLAQDSALNNLWNCFSDPTAATYDDVSLNVLGDNDEIVGVISVSPQINHQLRINDTSDSSNNEQFDKAQDGQTLRMEQVQVTTQQPICNDELNLCQASPSAGCSKRRKNCGEGRITRLAKKKELPSVASTIQTSGSFPKKVRGVLMRDSSPPYCCNICDKTFSDKSDWSRHQRKHSKPFVCPKCKKPFARKYDLSRHQATHSDEKPYKCGICDKPFKTNSGKTMHELAHAERARYECAVCGKVFNQRSSIIAHLNIHSDQKPFRCKTCGRRFAQKHHLVYHKRTHGKGKKFKCRISNQLFKHDHSKAMHERSHVEGPRFECALCGKKYRNKNGLAYHISHNCS
ncbi:zinc finger protein 239-like isoform X3 [Planococcus citri]|uniref:zinc finger protein 239-like isoform X3 n=1 Tax=Planococcus citri TaxID=170843 RepID=UPI0031F9B6F6